MLGGAAHLVNFMGSDTIAGIVMANNYYAAGMAGFSIPAAEHSTMTMWGKEHEADAYSNMLDIYKDQPIFACVSDSYDIFNAASKIWGEQLHAKVMEYKGTLVIRPDSGDPVKVVCGYSEKDYIYQDGKYFEYFVENGVDRIGDEISEAEVNGAIQVLWETFGGVRQRGMVS